MVEKNPFQVLKALQDISGSNAKVKFLKKHDNELLRNVIKHAVDPMITFGVKQYEFNDEPAQHSGFLHDLKYMDFALDTMRLNFNPATMFFMKFALALIMLGVALDINIKDLKLILKHPKSVT